MENLGEKIKQRRIEKKLSIEELSKETFLSIAIIKDIEAGKFDRYQGEETYVKMYLKKISEALDMNKEELTQSYLELTQQIKLAQLEEEKEKEVSNNEEIVKQGKDFNFSIPKLTRKKSVYEDKSHIKVIRIILIVVLVTLIVGVVWWGISATKSKVDNPTFDKTDTTKIDGNVTDDNTESKETKTNPNEKTTENSTTSKVTFTREENSTSKNISYKFKLSDSSDTFKFKVVYGNDSWSSMTVNNQNYSDFEAKIYKKDETVELEFKVSDFETLDLKNGYSMGHKYYINDEEIPLTEDDSSESISHLVLTIDK